jgi:hypothetical protein
MSEAPKTQYTIRDVPDVTNNRLREVAATLDISLNQAAVRALQRGLGLGTEPVSYRSLRHLVGRSSEVDRKGWKKTLSDMDQIHPEDWK